MEAGERSKAPAIVFKDKKRWRAVSEHKYQFCPPATRSSAGSTLASTVLNVNFTKAFRAPFTSTSTRPRENLQGQYVSVLDPESTEFGGIQLMLHD